MTRKLFTTIFATLLVAALATATIYFPATATRERDLYQGDFYERYNEVRCLRQGIDPFDVWSGKVQSDNFAKFRKRTKHEQEFVHSHMPWEYTMVYPMSFVPPKAAKHMVLTLNSLLYLALIGWTITFARKHGRSFATACLIAALAFGFNVWEWEGALFWGNYGGVLSAMLILIAVALTRDENPKMRQPNTSRFARLVGMFGGFGHNQILAGLAVSVMMVKPHIGFLFCIPLLVNRKITAVATGALACLFASILPAILCGKWPWVMIKNTLSGGGEYYHGSAFFNINYQNLIIRRHGYTADEVMYMSMAIGFVLCVAMSFMLRRSDDWFEKLIPPALIAPMWTYTVPHDLAIWTIPVVWLFARKIREWKDFQVIIERNDERSSLYKAKEWHAWVIALVVMAIAAVACYRSAWDWFKVWHTHVYPVLSAHFSGYGFFTGPPALGKTAFWWRYYDKGMGYGYKQTVLAIFFVWTIFRAWQCAKHKRRT